MKSHDYGVMGTDGLRFLLPPWRGVIDFLLVYNMSVIWYKMICSVPQVPSCSIPIMMSTIVIHERVGVLRKFYLELDIFADFFPFKTLYQKHYP
jgi:hypothetical protein